MIAHSTLSRRLRRLAQRSWRALRRNDSGDTVIEFAVVAGPLLIVTFLVIEAALVYYARVNTLAAATQGANVARAYGSNAAAGHDKAMDFLSQNGRGVRDPEVTVTFNGDEVTVTVSATARSIIPFVDIRVTHSAGGPVERFVS